MPSIIIGMPAGTELQRRKGDERDGVGVWNCRGEQGGKGTENDGME
jgi:hypothetical protein